MLHLRNQFNLVLDGEARRTTVVKQRLVDEADAMLDAGVLLVLLLHEVLFVVLFAVFREHEPLLVNLLLMLLDVHRQFLVL